MRLFSLTALALASAAGLVVACVGDEPLTTPAGAAGLDAATPEPPGDAATNPAPIEASTVDAGGTPVDAAPMDVDADADASTDAGPRCDPTKPFGPPTAILGLGGPDGDSTYSPQLTPDERTMFFSRRTHIDDDAGARRRIFVARREAPTVPFGPPQSPAGLGGAPPTDDYGLFLVPAQAASPPGRIFVLSANRDGLSQDYYRVDSTPDFTLFGFGKRIDSLSTGGLEGGASMSGDGKHVYFSRYDYPDGSASGRSVLYRATVDGALVATEIARVPGFETSDDSDAFASITPDERALYFSSLRGGDGFQIYVARRDSPLVPFGAPTRVAGLEGPVGISGHSGWISPDECRIYFARSDGLTSDIYVAERGR